jgi:hypothetical protein
MEKYTMKKVIPYSAYKSMKYKGKSDTRFRSCNPCFFCGKEIVNRATAKQIELNCSNNEIALVEGVIPKEQSQGWFLVGNDCYRKLLNIARGEKKCEIIGCNRNANRMVGCCMMCLHHIKFPCLVEKAEFLERAKKVREMK